MNLLYPRFSVLLFLPILGLAVLGALVAGLYGILHDQITYTIAPEYFTNMKFFQFSYANFGYPPRIFVAEIGFLATWWVGFIAGGLLARIAIPAWRQPIALRRALQAFGIIFVTAFLAGCVGGVLGYFHGPDYSAWKELTDFLKVSDPRSFVTVGYIHNASYLGALIGLVAAIVYLVIRKRRSA